MNQKKWLIIFYLLIGLALVGFISQLFGNTAKFLVNILLGIGFAIILFGLIYFISQRLRGGTSSEMKKYKQAVKQSKQKYQQHSGSTRKQSVDFTKTKKKKTKTKRRASHLRVIEGEKEKQLDKEKEKRQINM